MGWTNPVPCSGSAGNRDIHPKRLKKSWTNTENVIKNGKNSLVIYLISTKKRDPFYALDKKHGYSVLVGHVIFTIEFSSRVLVKLLTRLDKFAISCDDQIQGRDSSLELVTTFIDIFVFSIPFVHSQSHVKSVQPALNT